jgi:8-oxo-dGTP pyrophosphatase MutT (NUDIX family)
MAGAGQPATGVTDRGMTDRGGTATGSLRRLVVAHVPADERESASRRRFLAELDRLVDPCSETADPVHVTASAIVVGRRGTVLHRHRRLGRWLQPGGHVESGEDPAAAAVRETREETGLVAAHPPGGPRLVHVDVHVGGRGHTHLDLRFVVVAPDTDPAPAPGESPDAAWYDWDAAEAIADDALVGALRAARAAWAAQDAWREAEVDD